MTATYYGFDVQYPYYFFYYFQSLFKDGRERIGFTMKDILSEYGLPEKLISGQTGNEVSNGISNYTKFYIDKDSKGKYKLFESPKNKLYYVSDVFLNFIETHKNTQLVKDFMDFDFVKLLH